MHVCNPIVDRRCLGSTLSLSLKRQMEEQSRYSVLRMRADLHLQLRFHRDIPPSMPCNAHVKFRDWMRRVDR